ncbi:MAG: glycosyl transferase [Pseudonocardia sp.]|nr:glycosyl transferase [Pseudonocardia sp.]
MSHILMVGAGAHGHVNPHLPVIAELVERGHRVSYAIPRSFAEVVASTGATPLVHTSHLPDETRDEQWPSEPIEGMSIFAEDAAHVFPQLEAALEGDRPDLVLYDITGYAGRALAHRWGLPLVQLSPSMVAWEGYEEDMGEALAFRRDPRYAEYEHRFTAWLQSLGIDLDPDSFSGRPPRCVVLIPRALQPHADKVDDSVHTFVGPSLDRRPHQGDWPAPEKPLVLVSLGSAYTDRAEFFRTCVEAFGPLPWQVVIAIGRHTDPADVGELPPNVELHRWVPQLAVLRRASAFVTHAGMGGCSEGLYEGVPMIAVPQAVDQFGNAAMLQEIGVGVHLPAEEATADRLREALLQLTGSAQVAARLKAISEELRSAGGAAAAADVVEAQLR